MLHNNLTTTQVLYFKFDPSPKSLRLCGQYWDAFLRFTTPPSLSLPLYPCAETTLVNVIFVSSVYKCRFTKQSLHVQ